MKTEQSSPGLLGSQIFYSTLLAIVAVAFLGYRNIESKMAFYGVYHREPWNQFIHFFGVPGILWTAIMYGVHVPLPKILPIDTIQISILPGVPTHPLNFGILGVLIYGCSYLIIDPVGGILFAPFLYLMYASAVILREQDRRNFETRIQSEKKKSDESVGAVVPWNGTGSLLRFAVFFNVLCWYVQIHPGHHIIEGAKPALMDSLGDSFTAGPLFAYHELLFYLGLRQDLQERVQNLIAEYTAELCAAGSSMQVCNANM